ncbi:unnamed protein product [Euphydryas editha]|uniref:Uncharacterized protein n=1 Tax=Euphydryas editha TaxID=104508 RepID=A0AAU9VFC6_EUPED|nr:unnamed protein product [Euphydryas editha]
MSHRQFRTILAEGLLKTYRHIDLTTESRLITRPCGRQTTNMMMNDDNHNNNHDNNKTKYKTFTDEPTDRRWKPLPHAIWQCIECGVYLCIIGCFRDFHKP